ncbi:MAG: AzlD domain-containing protein [Desulfatiglandaceae bacterium]
MTDSRYILLLFGMAAVTYVPRWLPLWLLSGRTLPQWFLDWLSLIPVAVLSALLLPELVISVHTQHLDPINPKLLVAVPTFLVAAKTKSLLWAVLTGMVLYWAAGKLI